MGDVLHATARLKKKAAASAVQCAGIPRLTNTDATHHGSTDREMTKKGTSPTNIVTRIRWGVKKGGKTERGAPGIEKDLYCYVSEFGSWISNEQRLAYARGARFDL